MSIHSSVPKDSQVYRALRVGNMWPSRVMEGKMLTCYILASYYNHFNQKLKTNWPVTQHHTAK